MIQARLLATCVTIHCLSGGKVLLGLSPFVKRKGEKGCRGLTANIVLGLLSLFECSGCSCLKPFLLSWLHCCSSWSRSSETDCNGGRASATPVAGSSHCSTPWGTRKMARPLRWVAMVVTSTSRRLKRSSSWLLAMESKRWELNWNTPQAAAPVPCSRNPAGWNPDGQVQAACLSLPCRNSCLPACSCLQGFLHC